MFGIHCSSSYAIMMQYIVSTFWGTEKLGPHLLLLDEHLFHLWYGTIQLAKGRHITVIKLPAHTTDLLEPLDVAVYKSLKYQWGNVLFKRLKFTGANKIRIWQMWYSPIQSWYALQKKIKH